MDFQLSPNIKLPHQLYHNKSEGQEETQMILLQTEKCAKTHNQNPSHSPVRATTNQPSNFPVIPFPQSITPPPKSQNVGPATAIPTRYGSPETKDKTLESSREKIQMHSLKSCNKAQDETWVGIVDLITVNDAASSSIRGESLEENQ
ncbi:hypothetical protein MKX03_024812, partial [Papaver bracteatum]